MVGLMLPPPCLLHVDVPPHDPAPTLDEYRRLCHAVRADYPAELWSAVPPAPNTRVIDEYDALCERLRNAKTVPARRRAGGAR